MISVELTGPTGVGKSAVYAELLKLGGFTANPTIGIEEALKVVNDGANRWPETGDFISFLGWVFRSAQDHDGRLTKRESGTLRALAKHYMAKASDGPPMIVDGGLIHRGQGIDRLVPRMPVHRYFDLMPLPDVVFAFWCQPDVLAERNRARGGDHDRTDDLERQWRCHNLGLDILARRGAKIIPVDTTTMSPEKAAHAILVRLGIIRKYSGDHAATYEANRKSQAKWNAEQRIIEGMLNDLPSGSWVLDAPCGTGRFFDLYARKGFVVRALDREADMIAQAGAKLTQEQKTAMVGDVAQWKFIHGDVRDTKLPDKSVDAAVNCRITRWLSPEGNQEMLREMQRVARKRIIWTARIANHPYARPLSLFESALDGWKITRKEEAEPDYFVIMAEPA